MELLDIKSLGEKSVKELNKLNIHNTDDLLEFYPFRYEVIKFISFNQLSAVSSNYIKVTVVTNPKVSFIKRNFNRLTFKVLIENNEVNVTIFNRAFLRPNLVLNREIILVGKYNKIKNNFMASDIKFDAVDNTILPIYHLTNGLKMMQIRKYIKEALLASKNALDKIPKEYLEKYNFINKNDALAIIHNPLNVNELKKAKLRLIYEELFEFMFKINYLKEKNGINSGNSKIYDETKLEMFLNSLPFTPTIDQIKAFEDIRCDLTSDKRMNRLVMGDVGSGKTLVATYAIYLNYLAGYQTAFMAPTEVLARQHYEGISKFLVGLNIKIKLITGKMNLKEKNKIKTLLLDGKIDLLIGTHSIINDEVKFNNLGLVITDEQHRFGVMQRKSIENKGNNVDILSLSATPIPRTYALVLYGDCDISIIKSKPMGRKDIFTKICREQNIREVLEQIYLEIKKGHQIFVVAPLIEDNEQTDLTSVYKLKEKMESAFKNYASISVIHGSLKQKEKDEVMEEFNSNKVNILISTTVIEVGIDVPNATVMVIFNAERFGLATLHQLRGRVGRSNLDSYCYLVSNLEVKRLRVMEESNDGFYITEKDFEERKEGDLFGIKQSGDMAFKIADIKRDYEILLQCKKDSEKFLLTKAYTNNEYYVNLINDKLT